MNKEKQTKIVFVSGVFDIFHAGHVDFLKKAKGLVKDNGKLIVAIHDDKSVSIKKGSLRPINTLENRTKVLKAIKYVNEVICWQGWENIEDLVRKIRPDYIAVSGNEYKLKNIEQVAKQIGSKLVVFEKKADISTSIIIEKIGQNL